MERKVLVCHSQSLYRIRRSSPQLRYQVLQFICISCGHLVLLGNKTVVHNQCNFGPTNARMWEPSFKKQHRILIEWKYCSDSFNIWGWHHGDNKKLQILLINNSSEWPVGKNNHTSSCMGSARILIFHQRGLPWNKGISLPKRYLLG